MSITSLTVLLADDDTDDCIFFEEALAEMIPGAKFSTVHDGEKLMQLLLKNKNELPHILFLDLNMPRKNGFECLEEIKQDKAYKDLPVIIFSTSFEEEVVNLLYAKGAHFFIRKPPEFSLFKKTVLHTINHIMMSVKISQPARENFVFSKQTNN